jgi:hypothetical protein
MEAPRYSAMELHQLRRHEQRQWRVPKGLAADTRPFCGCRRLGWSRGVGFLGMIGLLGLLGWGAATPQGPDLRQQPSLLESSRHATRLGPYGQLPLSFEANQGQTDGQVLFLAHGQGYTLLLTAREAVFASRPPVAAVPRPTGIVPRTGGMQDTSDTARALVRMQLLGANPAPQVMGLEELPGKVNYFRGNEPHRWRTNVPTYAKVKYTAVYPGVDLIYYGHPRHLEYDFLVAPRADPTAIRIAFQGANRPSLDVAGNLILHAAHGEVIQHAPRAYQERDGARQNVPAHYTLADEGQVSIQVAAYDRDRPLIIDPILVYSTFLGGSGGDTGRGLAVDFSGNVYVTGWTDSPDFPTENPLQPTLRGGSNAGTDAYVAKLDPTGLALIYATYLGGSGDDFGFGMAVDDWGNAYLTGGTNSSDFPTMNAFQPTLGGVGDAYVAKLDPTGSALIYATYLGGSGDDFGYGIAVDITQSVSVTGQTLSTDFPTAHPLQPTFGGGSQFGDAFVTTLDPTGSTLVYSTYWGGDNEDQGRSIAVDLSGHAYVAGTTQSTNFPMAHPLQSTFGGVIDAFVAKFNRTGSALVYSTYLGGAQRDFASGIAVDFFGNAYVTGDTSSPDFPTKNPLQPSLVGLSGDAFVTKLDRSGSQLVYSTYLGGRDLDDGFAITVDAFQRATITGETFSADFPTQNPVQPAFGGGASDGFVATLHRSGSRLVFATHLGGSGFDFTVGVAADVVGDIYVTGDAGAADFPTVNPLQPTFGGLTDAFIAKICHSFELADRGCPRNVSSAGTILSPRVAPAITNIPSQMAWREMVLACKRAGRSPLDPACR